KQELLDIISAEENYNTTLISQSTQLENIQWEKERNKELFNMYSTLESDNAKYFSDGIITESEFRLSQVNKELYHYRMLINNIDLILYNCEIKSLFYDDNFSDDNSTSKAR
ncbi:MAG: hypothetical protein IJR49_00465, partial [Treponema sp.]|nr:hypothetical protein [Treponema sp.]